MNYTIRHATIDDLDEITELERKCFPAAERAPREEFAARLDTYPDRFVLIDLDGKIVSAVNGPLTEGADLLDEMFHDTSCHSDKNGWQMIFGVETDPEYRGRGFAKSALKSLIEQTKNEGRLGLVLTCKEALLPFYESVGFVNEGISGSNHGGARWYQMRISF